MAHATLIAQCRGHVEQDDEAPPTRVTAGPTRHTAPTHVRREQAMDAWPEQLRLAQLATHVLDAHISDGGHCNVCRSSFPCSLAVLAEHTLAGL